MPTPAKTASVPASPLMTTDEVADYTRLSVETLRYFRQREEGPRWAKLGRRVFYRRQDVDAWIAASLTTTR
jgi:excisionase family DNA binding protein